ncbi:MAG TPA: hypothetical protein VF556_17570 [Pyrinomonadaceae bacterium]|jgi:hypothetical protein
MRGILPGNIISIEEYRRSKNELPEKNSGALLIALLAFICVLAKADEEI